MKQAKNAKKFDVVAPGRHVQTIDLQEYDQEIAKRCEHELEDN
eukprot:CAMPEP_0116892006 /NCGR_PEP_ID=MMETSP0467-20121206/2313_1 /TAXON_ID=283647 /ORGANISM="Mesodinium pulex, Strain SPMC105" /LENGTH=42 /DNA_ID= /DNA_START= /DNA_END= /DNA_ORIENTATION=